MSEGNGFTTKEILLQMREEMRDSFEELKENMKEGHRDHEIRIRLVERARWQARGSIALTAFVIPVLASLSWHVWG